MAKIGISQEQWTLLNPLPRVTQREITDAAAIYDPSADDKQDFVMEWQFSTGEEREFIVFEPGRPVQLQKQYAAQALEDLRELGLVQVQRDDIRSAALRGLNEAKKHFAANGALRLNKEQSRMGYTEEQMKLEHSNKHAPLHRNIARERAIDAEIQRVSVVKKTA